MTNLEFMKMIHWNTFFLNDQRILLETTSQEQDYKKSKITSKQKTRVGCCNQEVQGNEKKN